MMEFITKDVVTAEWESKKQFYRFVWMEGRDGTMVDVQVWDWEYTREGIENSIEQLNLAIAEQKARLAFFRK